MSRTLRFSVNRSSSLLGFGLICCLIALLLSELEGEGIRLEAVLDASLLSFIKLVTAE